VSKKSRPMTAIFYSLRFDENGNSAHGKTIKEARADLIYKNVAKFEAKYLSKPLLRVDWNL
jgi:hypothetical protein